MGAFLDIQSAFEVRLAAMPGGLTLTAHEGEEFTPGTSPYQEIKNLPVSSQAAGAGVDALNRHDGIFQVSLFYPAGSGAGAAIGQADAVASWFKRGTRLNKGNASAQVVSASRGPVLEEPKWVMVPVSIQYYAHAPN